MDTVIGQKFTLHRYRDRAIVHITYRYKDKAMEDEITILNSKV